MCKGLNVAFCRWNLSAVIFMLGPIIGLTYYSYQPWWKKNQEYLADEPNIEYGPRVIMFQYGLYNDWVYTDVPLPSSDSCIVSFTSAYKYNISQSDCSNWKASQTYFNVAIATMAIAIVAIVLFMLIYLCVKIEYALQFLKYFHILVGLALFTSGVLQLYAPYVFNKVEWNPSSSSLIWNLYAFFLLTLPFITFGTAISQFCVGWKTFCHRTDERREDIPLLLSE